VRYREVAALLTLAALWGGSFLAIRLAAPAFGPFALIDVRVLLAAAALVHEPPPPKASAQLPSNGWPWPAPADQRCGSGR